MNFLKQIRSIEWIALGLFLALLSLIARNGYLWHVLIAIMIVTLALTAFLAYRNIRRERLNNSR